MLLPRKDVDSVEHAIGRRLDKTMVSGWVRPFDRVGTVRTVNVAASGLFLVKPATAGGAMETPTLMEKVRTARVAKLQVKATQGLQNKKSPGRVIPMRMPGKQARQDRVLGLMAAMGPLLWFGHAALVWLKVV